MEPRFPALSPREQRVLAMIGKGYATDAIAAKLGISKPMTIQLVSRAITYVKQRGRAEKGESPTLTRRQAQVAEYLRAGATDREIATHLQVGVRTAETHVAAVLRKLGVRTRSALQDKPPVSDAD